MDDRKLDIKIDLDRCVGSATCVVTAERAFATGPDGKAELLDPEAEDRAALLDAVALCPAEALSAFDASTGARIEP